VTDGNKLQPMNSANYVPNLESFLQGRPLTKELADLQEGQTITTSETAQFQGIPIDTRALDDDDREHLRRLEVEPGWPIAMRILDREIEAQEGMAREMSSIDPLGNQSEIAKLWAYVAMMKRTRNFLVSTIHQEVLQLEDK